AGSSPAPPRNPPPTASSPSSPTRPCATAWASAADNGSNRSGAGTSWQKTSKPSCNPGREETPAPQGARGTAHLGEVPAHACSPPGGTPSGARGTAHLTKTRVPYKPRGGTTSPQGARGTTQPYFT